MSKLFKLTLVLALLAIMMAACQPTTTTVVTDEPEATEEGPFEGTTLSADCLEEGGSTINSIAATDRYTVTFTLCGPDPAFREKVAFTAFSIQSSEWLEETGGTGELLEHPVGTGPFMMSEWNRGDSIVLTRYDDYWGEKPAYQTLVFRWSTEAAARRLELEAGSVDGIDNVGPEDIEPISGNADLQLINRPALNVFYVAMNSNAAPFDDVKVRQAVAMGVDRQRIVDQFYPEGSEVASHFTPCDIPNACVGDPWYDFDLDAARALLEEAGYADGFETNLYYRDVVRGYLPEPGVVAQDIQAQLQENLNITINIEVMESGTFLEESSAGNLEGMHLLGWGADYPHITNFLDYHFGRANLQFGAPIPEIYELLEQGAQMADVAAAESTYVEANNKLRELVPMIPVAHGASAMAYRADVADAHTSPLTSEYFAVMTPGDRDQLVIMQNAEPPGLYCADETDGEALRICEQVTENLLTYEIGGVAVVPSLATGCEPNEDLTVWTCTLREGVTFHDGTTFDANDVVASWTAFLDASSPLHVGNTGAFDYPAYLWGLMNAPAPEE